ncbi:hypothetical protein H7H37_07705, partial [Mycolicibacterium insubricum]|nr:hypothetical protein [Mycolicibacterium insubricum]
PWFSLHLTGGVVMVTFLVAWWCIDALWHPVRGRLADLGTLSAVGAPALVIMLPQFLGVLDQAEIIAGHAFVTGVGKKQALFNAVFQHTRHLNDWPIQNMLIACAALGAAVLLVGGCGGRWRSGCCWWLPPCIPPRRSAARSAPSSGPTPTCSTAIRAACRRW